MSNKKFYAAKIATFFRTNLIPRAAEIKKGYQNSITTSQTNTYPFLNVYKRI